MSGYDKLPLSTWEGLKLTVRAILGGVPYCRGMPETGWPNWAHPHVTADLWLQGSVETATLEQIESIRAHRVYHFKDAKGKFQHEFLIIKFEKSSLHEDSRTVFLRCERIIDKGSKHANSPVISNISSDILSNQPEERKDHLMPLAPVEFDHLLDDVKHKRVRLLQTLDFLPQSLPTILDVAAVLEAHSTLSTEYRLRATMCYWFAGSTYAILQELYQGHSEPTTDVHKQGKLGWITGYQVMKQEENSGVSAMVAAVRRLEGNDQPLGEAQLRDEIKKIPSFVTLKAHSTSRTRTVYQLLGERHHAELEKIQKVKRAEEVEAMAVEMEARAVEVEARAEQDRQALYVTEAKQAKQTEMIEILRHKVNELQT